MRTSETFDVGGTSYQVNMWHPDIAIENLTWLIKMVGEPVIAAVVTAGSIEEMLDGKDAEAMLIPAVRSLVANLNEKEVVAKVQLFTKGILANGAKVDYGNYFMGRIGHLMKVLVQILKAQYSDFFDAIPAGIMTGKSGETLTGTGSTAVQ